MSSSKLGVSRSLLGGLFLWPIHALRHSPEGDTNGWYLWTGEFKEDDDFFTALHAEHLIERFPDLGPHLRLPPGTRFMWAPGSFDVWFDEALLDT